MLYASCGATKAIRANQWRVTGRQPLCSVQDRRFNVKTSHGGAAAKRGASASRALVSNVIHSVYADRCLGSFSERDKAGKETVKEGSAQP